MRASENNLTSLPGFTRFTRPGLKKSYSLKLKTIIPLQSDPKVAMKEI